MKYYVLTIGEDGDVYLQEILEERLLDEINDGSIDVKQVASEIGQMDVMEGGAKTYIFKGELVVPKPKKVVKEYEL